MLYRIWSLRYQNVSCGYLRRMVARDFYPNFLKQTVHRGSYVSMVISMYVCFITLPNYNYGT